MPRLSELQAIMVDGNPSRAERLTEALQQLAQDLEEAIAQAFQAMLAEAMASAFWPLRGLLELLQLLEQAATDTTAAERLLELLGIDQGALAKHNGDPRVVRGYLIAAVKDALTRRDENQGVRVRWQGKQATGRIRPIELPLPLALGWLEWRIVTTARQWLETLNSELAEPTWSYRRRKRREVPLEEAILAAEVSVEELALAAAAAEDILQLLYSTASPQQRQIVELLVSGYERSEAAAILGIEDSTIRVQLARLRQKLTALM